MPEQTQKEKDISPLTIVDYDEYLSVFGILGFFLLVFLVLHILYIKAAAIDWIAEKAYLISSFSGVALTIALSFYFSRNKHGWFLASLKMRFRHNDTIAKVEKKVVLILSFVSYLTTLNILTIWAGGSINSYFGNLLLLTASLSTYVAYRTWTKLFVSILTVGSYILTSFIRYDQDSLSLHTGRPQNADYIMYYLIVIFICFISWLVSTKVKVED